MKPLIVANWKANKDTAQVASFIKEARASLEEVTHAEVVICPSFVVIPSLASLLEGSSIKVGAQDVSEFEKGAYTGEVTALMLSRLVKYCLVGHSERRRYFGDDNDSVRKKIELLKKAKIIPILCASFESDIPEGIEAEGLVAVYEPSAAISTEGVYHPDTPENAQNMARIFKEILKDKCPVLYGGSVNENNVTDYVSGEISGVLVGNASLDSRSFVKVVSNARFSSNMLK